MSATANDINPEDALSYLRWLGEMGSDESVAEEAADWLARSVAAKLIPAVQQAVPMRSRPIAAADVTPAPRAIESETLQALLAEFRASDVQGLSKSAQSFCFLDAVPDARVLVIGDRPRTDEETEGKVFAGKSETLLRAMLKSIGLSYPGDGAGEQVSVANLVPWRPPGNRTPTEIEANMCAPFLRRAIELLQPRLVLALGALPGKTLAQGGASVALQRDRWLSVNAGDSDVPMRVTFHPVELLAFPERKRQAWQDLLEVRKKLTLLGGAR
jgi:uracil-DNA glycosylase